MQHSNSVNNFFCLEDDMSIMEKYLHLAKKQIYKKDDEILGFNQPLDCLYYIKKGKICRIVNSANGNEKYMKVVCEKSILGEVIFFQQIKNDTSFRTIEQCECYLFDRVTVENVLLEDKEVVKALINWFCNRMQALNMQINDTLSNDSYYRICKFLYDYIMEFGKKINGVYVYEGKLSHYDIAKYLGINRVIITRTINQLQEEGILSKDRKKLVILDIQYLEKYIH